MNMRTLLILTACLSGLTVRAAAPAAATWMTDLPAAQAKAKAENKFVLLNFTGSDWCGWCIRLKKEVLAQTEFETFAAEHLVLVEVDFPHGKPQTPALKNANAALAQKYEIKGFPTLVVLNSAGETAGRIGYVEGGPKRFIARLKPLLATPSTAEETPKKGQTGPAAPSQNGAPALAPARYSKLTLRGISGPPNARLALINNQSLGVGESGRIKLGDREVKVRCLAINDKSVTVMVEGEKSRRELRLREEAKGTKR
jgi:protein disulfide-isomerase